MKKNKNKTPDWEKFKESEKKRLRKLDVMELHTYRTKALAMLQRWALEVARRDLQGW